MSLFATSAPRRLAVAAAWAFVSTAASLLVVPGALAHVDQFPRNEHGKASLDVALNLSVCRRRALQSTMFAPARYLTEHPEALRLSPRELIARSGVSVEAYCATLSQPITNNENSLMLMEAITWIVRPSASVSSLGRVLAWVRVVAVFVFALACFHAGLSAALGFIVTCGAISVLPPLVPMEYTVYPFLLSVPLVWVAACTLLYRPIREMALWPSLAIGVGAGLLAGFGVNFRSSYLAIVAVVSLLVVGGCYRAWKADSGRVRAWQRVVATFGAFAMGMWTFNVAVMQPLEHPAGAATTNYTYHAVAHSLVISLAVPPNPLSRSEGIRWDDMVGRDIALRVQPGVAYLGPEYERTLFKYYFGLWRVRPRDMIATYWTKLLRTSRGVFLFASDLVPSWRPLRKIYLVWADRMNGVELIAATASLTVFAGWMLWRTAAPAALLAASVCAAVTLLLLESALIYSEFTVMYHSFLLFVVVIGPAVFLQIAWDAGYALRR